MSLFDSTIVAQSTTKGLSAIASARLSGKDAFFIACKICQKEKLNQVNVTYLYDEKNNKFDQSLVLFFENPNSYTGEDIVEFHTHGNQLIIEKLIETCLYSGARLATPGEFTQRALINGKLNLSQAESVLDLIHSKTEQFLQASLNQLSGKLSDILSDIKKQTLQALSFVQAHIDFPIEIEEDHIDLSSVKKIVKQNIEILSGLCDSARSSNIFRQGVKTVILGRPNVGKSSLLNLLLNNDRAIVSPIAGTTRDYLEEQLVFRGIPLILIDTAGLRKNTEDQIEQIGITRSIEQAKKADLILFIYEAPEGFTEEDRILLENIQEANPSAQCILLANKSDLESQITVQVKKEIQFSVLTKSGIDELEKNIKEKLSLNETEGDFSLAITQRQSVYLHRALEILQSISFEDELDLISINLQDTLQQLDYINDFKSYDAERTLDSIFSDFCIGK